jgi:hypothetical protein
MTGIKSNDTSAKAGEFSATVRPNGKVCICGEGENGDPFFIRLTTTDDCECLIELAKWGKWAIKEAHNIRKVKP